MAAPEGAAFFLARRLAYGQRSARIGRSGSQDDPPLAGDQSDQWSVQAQRAEKPGNRGRTTVFQSQDRCNEVRNLRHIPGLSRMALSQAAFHDIGCGAESHSSGVAGQLAARKVWVFVSPIGALVGLCCNKRRHRRKKAPNPDDYRQLVQQRLSKGRWHSKSLATRLAA
jgi:hypothetical protein